MHTLILVIAAILTVCIAGPAARGSLLKAWMLAPLTFVPYLLLYMAFRDGDHERIFLAPVFLMATILLAKSVRRLFTMAADTPRAALNAPASDAERPHWAAA